MWRFSLAISYFFFVSTIVRTTDVEYCDGNEEYEVKVQRVDISSYPIVRGEPATFSISANTDNVISRGKLVNEVSYFGWHIHSETHYLCDETKCLVVIGDFLVTHSQMLPGSSWTSKSRGQGKCFNGLGPDPALLKMKMVDGHKKELTCIKFSYKIGFGSSLAVDI